MTSTCMKESWEVSLKFTQCDHQKTRKRSKYGFGKILKIFSLLLLSAICTELYHIKNLNPLNQIQSQRFITSIVSSKVCVDKLNQAFSNNQYSWKKSTFQLKVITLERWQEILGYLGHHIKVSYVITRVLKTSKKLKSQLKPAAGLSELIIDAQRPWKDDTWCCKM